MFCYIKLNLILNNITLSEIQRKIKKRPRVFSVAFELNLKEFIEFFHVVKPKKSMKEEISKEKSYSQYTKFNLKRAQQLLPKPSCSPSSIKRP